MHIAQARGWQLPLIQVVAPVRETAAQAIGAAVQPLPVPQAEALLSLLHQLIQQQQWDVRHGGLLGLKYLLAARTDASQSLMPQALLAAVLGLKVCLCSGQPSQQPYWRPCCPQILHQLVLQWFTLSSSFTYVYIPADTVAICRCWYAHAVPDLIWCVVTVLQGAVQCDLCA